MRLPQLLQSPDDPRAVAALCRYYGTHGYSDSFTGARFDSWDSTGSRSADRDRFTADDLVAVTFLSVNVPAQAAILLLDSKADRFSELLTDLGDDRDLVGEKAPLDIGGAGSAVWTELMSLPGVGPTTASKLLARKRPRLRPIYDSVVAEVVGSTRLWEPLRMLLTSEPALHDRLLHLRGEAGLSDDVSALRVFDVVAWMEGKYGLAQFGQA